MTKAAGILFKTPENSALFLKRGPGGDYPGFWCFPGGRLEGGESAEDAAKREAVEEVGSLPPGERTLLARNLSNPPLAASPPAAAEATPGPVDALPPSPGVAEAVDFSTFLQEVEKPFAVVRDDEHVGYAWAPVNEPPEPLHPGCRIALDRLFVDELGVARMMARGDLTSPQRYKNVTLWAMRITGTGVSYRATVYKRGKDGEVVLDEKKAPVVERRAEFPFRDPKHYLNDDFLARCNGLPVIWAHPEKALLDAKEFVERVVGTIFYPYLRLDLDDGEVWGIAKVYDEDANAAMLAGTEEGKPFSTSPCVVVSDPNSKSYKLETEDGRVLLIEGRPSLLDHLAICERGVWDKGGEPAGIINHELEEKEEIIMADKDDKDVKDDTVAEQPKADATPDKLLAAMDACMARMDAFEDKFGKKADAADEKDEKADAADVKDDAAGDATKVAADASARADAAIADAAAARGELGDIRGLLADMAKRLPVERTDADVGVMTGIQVRADAVYSLFGKAAPRFVNGEEPLAYRRRLARDFQEHSPAWKEADLGVLADSVLSIAENAIYADAANAAKNPATIGDEGIRLVPGTSGSGHRVNTFVGRPSAWMGRFGGSKRFATAITPRRQERA